MAPLEVVPSDVTDIQAAILEAIQTLHETAARVEMSIGKVIVAGRKLRTKREGMEHGTWMPWVEANVTAATGVTYQTVRNWIKLAEFAERKGSDLENAQTVRQAYILAGLLPEPESSEGGNRQQNAGNYLVHVARLERAIKVQIEAKPIEEWSREDRQILRQRLQWCADLLEKLEAA